MSAGSGPRTPPTAVGILVAVLVLLLAALIAAAWGPRALTVGLVAAAAVGFAGFVLRWQRTLRRDRATIPVPPPEMPRSSGPVEPPPGAAERAELASMVAHELRNPIMSIKGLAATGTSRYDELSDRERREFFGLIDQEASHLRFVADEIATALRIDVGLVAYRLRPEPLGPLIEEAVSGSRLGTHPVTVDVETDLAVLLDRARMAEVITHLLHNAAKFSPPTAPIEIRVRRGEQGDALLEIEDRGPGIPVDLRDRVFERFARHRPPGYEAVPGAGLGLFICRSHVLAHGGSVEVEPGPDGGTILRVRLRMGGGQGG